MSQPGHQCERHDTAGIRCAGHYVVVSGYDAPGGALRFKFFQCGLCGYKPLANRINVPTECVHRRKPWSPERREKYLQMLAYRKQQDH